MVREIASGFEDRVVTEDSLYGERKANFLGCLEELNLNFVVGYQNHGVWLPPKDKRSGNQWRKFDLDF